MDQWDKEAGSEIQAASTTKIVVFMKVGRRVVWQIVTNVSKEPPASIFRIKI
jgi:hypothetical protein